MDDFINRGLALLRELTMMNGHLEQIAGALDRNYADSTLLHAPPPPSTTFDPLTGVEQRL